MIKYLNTKIFFYHIPSTVIRWCVFFMDSLMASVSRGRMDLRFIISAEIPSFANSSAASTQKWTPIECATRVISFPGRCIRAYILNQALRWETILSYLTDLINAKLRNICQCYLSNRCYMIFIHNRIFNVKRCSV